MDYKMFIFIPENLSDYQFGDTQNKINLFQNVCEIDVCK